MKLVSTKEVFQAGFTLVELIIVIVVIGILAAVAIPKFGDIATSAKTAGEQATLQAVRTAIATAYATANGPPTSQQVAAAVNPNCTDVEVSTATCSGTPITFVTDSNDRVTNANITPPTP